MKQAGNTVTSVQSLQVGLPQSDLLHIMQLVRSTGNFTEAEVAVAREVAEEYLQKGEDSGYNFLRFMIKDEVCGFCCFGPIPCTINRFEIYWIVVGSTFQHMGIGTSLLKECEKRIRTTGGTSIYLDTSSKYSYQAARSFYEKNGFVKIALLEDFYADSDDKIIYKKKL